MSARSGNATTQAVYLTRNKLYELLPTTVAEPMALCKPWTGSYETTYYEYRCQQMNAARRGIVDTVAAIQARIFSTAHCAMLPLFPRLNKAVAAITKHGRVAEWQTR